MTDDASPVADASAEASSAAWRLVVGVVLCAALLVAFVVGLGITAGDGRSTATRLLGGAVLAGSVFGIARLLRWARGSAWTYDRPQVGVSAGEMFLLGFGCIVLFAVLVEPLGIWAFLAFVVPVVPVIRLRYPVSTLEALALGAGLMLLIIRILAAVLARGGPT